MDTLFLVNFLLLCIIAILLLNVLQLQNIHKELCYANLEDDETPDDPEEGGPRGTGL
jgi:hypothetical protein